MLLITRLAIPFSLITLLVIGFLRVQPGDQELIDQYHERVATAVNSTPLDKNGWIGQQVPLPQSAISLLRPNALVARRYIYEEKGIVAKLVIVHCRDARDMAGHYPPRCYPANGWMESEDNPVRNYTLNKHSFRVYGFHRLAGKVERDMTVYSFFALPTGELSTSMVDVRRLSADYQFRKYGAAQIQIVIDGGVSPEDHPWILEEMYKIAEPAIEAVLDAPPSYKNTEGGES
jgi:Protein of unknown function (DUF3485)